MTPRAVLPKCGSPLRPSARTRYLVADTEPWCVRGKLNAVHELDAGPRILGEEQVAVEIDVVAEARHRRARGDAEARLDHAAEHHAETERTRRMGHADALADPAGLRQLDVDPVRALGALRDVRQRVAILVNENRDGRARLQLEPIVGARGQRLLAVLDVHLRQ